MSASNNVTPFGAKILEAAVLREFASLLADTLGGRWVIHWTFPMPPDGRRNLVVEWERAEITVCQYFSDVEINMARDPRGLILQTLYNKMKDVDPLYRQEESRRDAFEPHPINLDFMRREDV